MSAVRMLEMAGDRPEVRAKFVELDELPAALAPAAGISHFRLLELARGDAGIDWTGITRMRNKALGLLSTYLREHAPFGLETVILEVSGRPRVLEGGPVEVLRRHALSAVPIVVLDVQVPRGQTNAQWLQALASWETVLEGAEDGPKARRIERQPPAASEAAGATEDSLRSLLADPDKFWDSATVGRVLSQTQDHKNPKMVASRARRRGEIFGAWDGNAYRYPAFQFLDDGAPRPDVQALIEVLPRDADGSGQDAALWLHAPDAALDGLTPAEAFVEDPARVIELARARRDGADDRD